MNTTRNRSLVLARFIRGAVSDLRESTVASPARVGTVTAERARFNALDTLAAVAEELELAAATEEPAT